MPKADIIHMHKKSCTLLYAEQNATFLIYQEIKPDLDSKRLLKCQYLPVVISSVTVSRGNKPERNR